MSTNTIGLKFRAVVAYDGDMIVFFIYRVQRVWTNFVGKPSGVVLSIFPRMISVLGSRVLSLLADVR